MSATRVDILLNLNYKILYESGNVHSSRSCTRHSLVTSRLASARDRTPVCCMGRVSETYTPISWRKEGSQKITWSDCLPCLDNLVCCRGSLLVEGSSEIIRHIIMSHLSSSRGRENKKFLRKIRKKTERRFSLPCGPLASCQRVASTS